MKIIAAILLGFLLVVNVLGLRTDTLVVYNKTEIQSLKLAYRYCSYREIDPEYMVGVECSPSETIPYSDFKVQIMDPIYAKANPSTLNVTILQGIPYKIANSQYTVQQLVSSWKNLLQWYGDPPILPLSAGFTIVNKTWAGAKSVMELNYSWNGDGFDYERWLALQQPIDYWRVLHFASSSYDITNRMLDDIIITEINGWSGICYIDQRKATDPISAKWDLGLLETSEIFKPYGTIYCETTNLLPNDQYPITNALFAFEWYNANQSPGVIDAPWRMMAPGSIGWSVYSASASSMATPTSSFAAKFLADGACATVGAVTEPFLHNFPRSAPVIKMMEKGHTLGEALYNSVPYPGFRVSFFGDPLYKINFQQINQTGIWRLSRLAMQQDGFRYVLQYLMEQGNFEAAELLLCVCVDRKIENADLVNYLKGFVTSTDPYKQKSSTTKLYQYGIALEDVQLRQWTINQAKLAGYCWYFNWWACK